MNPIQKIIQDSNEEFDLLWGEAPIGTLKYGRAVDIKSFISVRDRKILEGVRTEVELMDNPYQYGITKSENRAFAEARKRVCDLTNKALGK